MRNLLAIALLGSGALLAQAPNTITFDAIPNQLLGVSPFLIAARASSGLPMAIVSNTPAVCRNSSDLVMLLSAGTCLITATQSGNAAFSAATPVTRSFTVSVAKASGVLFPATGSPFAVATSPYSLVVGDFNGDGIPDIATANEGSANVTVLLGNGLGGFTAASGSPAAVAPYPYSMTNGDFNGDGVQDLAVASGYSHNVTVLLGNGSGGFTTAVVIPFAVGSAPVSIAVADFNGDGIQDLAVADEVHNNVTVLLGNGSGGGFTAAAGSPFAVGGIAPRFVAAGDFNGDGIPDLVTVNDNTLNVSVLLGNGLGGFTASAGSPFAVGNAPDFAAVGDFNGDGVQDLAVANYSTSNITVLLGNGLGGFTPAAGSPFTVGTNPVSIAVADFNGDGIPDLATANGQSYDVTVLLGNGSGGFTQAVGSPFAVGGLPSSIAVADFDRDGVEDLATANGSVVVLLGTALGHASQTITFAPLNNVTYGAAAFFLSATASSGLVVNFASITPSVCTVAGSAVVGTAVYIVGGGTCLIVASQAGSAVYAPTAVTQSFTVNTKPQTISFGPLANASYVSATASSGLPVTLASTTPSVCTLSGAVVSIVGPGVCSITAGQAGNAYYSAAPNVVQSFTVTSGNPTISFDPIPNQILGVSPFPIAAQDSYGLAVGFTSNTPAVCRNSADLVMLLRAGTCSITAGQNPNVSYSVATPVTRTFSVAVARPSGSLTAAAGSPFAAGPDPNSVAVGDFNRDGIQDLAVADGGGNSITVLLGNGSGGFTPAPGSPFAVGASPGSIAVGDFNGDGIQDLVTANKFGNSITVLLGNGSGGFTATAGSPFAGGPSPLFVAVGDFNGDGIQDLAVANPYSYSTYIGNFVTVLLGDGAGGFTPAPDSPFAVGASPEYIAVGDFNGDGIQDLATAVTVLLGNGSGGFTAAGGSPFAAGTPPYAAVVGDFNGDGIQDLATANGGGNSVTVLLGNGAGGFTPAPGSPFAVGPSPEFIAVADFNGDGIQDLVVANYAGSSVTVLLGNGSGGFMAAAGSPFVAGASPSSLAVGDFNGDGIEDLVTVNAGGGVTVLLGAVVGTTQQTITFGPLSNVTIGSAPFTLRATSSSGLAVAFSLASASSFCSVTGATVAIPSSGHGICSIVATQAGNAVYAPAAPVTQSFMVTELSQTITFAPLGNVSYTALPFLIFASAGSGIEVSFVSTTAAVCTVDGSQVTVVGPGTCSIVASQMGNAIYMAAPNVTQSFQVTSIKPSEAGIFRTNFEWLLDANGNRQFDGTGAGKDYVYFNFIAAQTGDVPVVGDWSGSGTTKIGVYRPSSGQWFLDFNGNGIFDSGDREYNFGGLAGDKPVVGDWSGSGTSKIGIFRSGFFWLLDANGDGMFDGGDLAFAYGGVPGDVPVAGDWTGDGIAKVGIVRPFQTGGTPALWILDANNDRTIDTGDLFFAFGGIAGDMPVVGDWNGTGFAKAGVFRQGFYWVVDNNGSAAVFPGSSQLAAFAFGGIAGDVPITGKW